VQNRVAMALRMAATTLLNSKTYLGSRYRQLRKQLPSHAAAVKAMAHYLALLVNRLLITAARASRRTDGGWRSRWWMGRARTSGSTTLNGTQ